MLAYILAIAVGLLSLAFYNAAFFLPEVHRKDDFFWSGIGLFYALVLWVCAGRIAGGVLLGQIASVTLLAWFGWETLSLRRRVASPDEKTKIPESFYLTQSLQDLLGQVASLFRRQSPQSKPSPTAALAEQLSASPQEEPAEGIPAQPEGVSEVAEESAEMPGATTQADETEEAATLPETLPPSGDVQEEETVASEPPKTETASKPKRRFSLGGLLRRPRLGKQKPQGNQTPAKTTSPTEMQEPSPTQSILETEEVIELQPESPELEAVPPTSPTQEIVEAAQADAQAEKIPEIEVEEVAPEAQIAPPAEPLGEGDPQMRQDLMEENRLSEQGEDKSENTSA